MKTERAGQAAELDLFVLRHAATEWNAQKRFQGRRDIPLSEEGRISLQGKRLPSEFRSIPWFVSPLQRAQQTAQELGITEYITPAALIEMDWGDWEGERLPDLRKQLGSSMQDQESRGLDLQPPGGESPRQVRQRVLQWLADTPFTTAQAGIISHKGVIRAMLSAALDWEMRDKCPLKVRWDEALRFRWSDGRLTLVDYNIPLSD
ncbi:phosphoglycerate mutase [Marinobacterium zhoushanense]|uniref:Phosphoglycerate mutase n=1 Tax=Marinobacterium zhoushanense TaxID=1679163 RepID=A0ABQ1KBY0_9GAMM|nr:histidine phosphatase family protein [Marinobacterium zhoushanense]GGB95083.1 phosphoglycerate mutase [Marinobacterium zhoushanense]